MSITEKPAPVVVSFEAPTQGKVPHLMNILHRAALELHEHGLVMTYVAAPPAVVHAPTVAALDKARVAAAAASPPSAYAYDLVAEICAESYPDIVRVHDLEAEFFKRSSFKSASGAISAAVGVGLIERVAPSTYRAVKSDIAGRPRPGAVGKSRRRGSDRGQRQRPLPWPGGDGRAYWQIIRDVCIKNYPSVLTYKELIAAVEKIRPSRPGSVRPRIEEVVKRGLIERVGPSEFRAMQYGPHAVELHAVA